MFGELIFHDHHDVADDVYTHEWHLLLIKLYQKKRTNRQALELHIWGKEMGARFFSLLRPYLNTMPATCSMVLVLWKNDYFP